MSHMKVCTLLVSALGFIRTIPVDNGVEGEPEIECGPTAITVNFNTRNPFEGDHLKIYHLKYSFFEKSCSNNPYF